MIMYMVSVCCLLWLLWVAWYLLPRIFLDKLHLQIQKVIFAKNHWRFKIKRYFCTVHVTYVVMISTCNNYFEAYLYNGVFQTVVSWRFVFDWSCFHSRSINPTESLILLFPKFAYTTAMFLSSLKRLVHCLH